MRVTFIIVAAALLLAAARATPAPAQDIEGMIDLEDSIERQIAILEQMVGGDSSARNQVVILQWLIDLYEAIGRTDGVESCYRRILTFFPNDVGTLNQYGRYLMDTVGDNERADKVLYDAYAWGKAIDARAIDMGTTYQLRAELMRRMGDYEQALGLSEHALELLSTERSAEVLRTRAKTLEALERYDEAAAEYLRLIGLDRAASPEDVNALKLIVSKTTTYSAEEVDDHIADAVEAYRKREVARIELGGGAVVTIAAGDGVVLEGTMRTADGPGAVLMIHDAGDRRSVFTPYAQLLYIDGISSLAVDLRGHGGSRADSMLSYDRLSAYNRDRLADDVVAAYRYLQQALDLPDERVAIIAVGTSAAIAEKAIYRGRLDAPVVYLSPTFPDDDRELDTAIAFHADHPALVVSAREDLSALRTIRRFEAAKERDHLATRLYHDAGYGIETLRRIPEALEGFQAWLRRVVGAS